MMTRITSVVVLFVLVVAGCSSSSEPTATFTGSACDYSGPSEFDVNSTVTFTYTNESDTTGAGFSVWKLPEGLTAEEIFEQGIFNVTDSGSAPTNFISRPTVIGEEYELSVVFDETGQHGMVCWVSPGPETGSEWVTMFTVNG